MEEPVANVSRLLQARVKQEHLEDISHYIYAIVYPVVFLLGIVGNMLSCLLFSITKLNRTSCGMYFLLLAVADTVALIGGLHHCLVIGFRVSVASAAYCRVRNFLLYTAMDIASWMVVAISVDRYLKMKYPIKAREYATRKVSFIVSCCISAVFALKNVHLTTVFIGDFTDDAADHCDPNPDYPGYVTFFKNVWPWIDLAAFALFPFVIVTVCNAFIIRDQYKRRLRLRKRNLDHSLITLLLVSAISLVVCNLPVTVLAVVYPYVSLSYDTNDTYDEVAFAFDILRLPSYGSLALNFYLYYYTSVIFRQQAVLLFKQTFRIPVARNNEFELMNRRQSEPQRYDQRVYSIDEADDYPQTPAPMLIGSSYVSNFFRPPS